MKLGKDIAAARITFIGDLCCNLDDTLTGVAQSSNAAASLLATTETCTAMARKLDVTPSPGVDWMKQHRQWIVEQTAVKTVHKSSADGGASPGFFPANTAERHHQHSQLRHSTHRCSACDKDWSEKAVHSWCHSYMAEPLVTDN
ncbi:hypothetical protein OPT61_g3178 [Boeremia exigua]|uniref:Uncharacterized protein n=1 Tax=Boeremia exigua TaxID=749465 RepID=A0ACC2IIV9_9PLEO|nr:hypothetical protein OPT61_g3178 [Boeremia exigua]